MNTKPQPLIRFASSMLAVFVFTASNFASITGTEKAWQLLNTASAGWDAFRYIHKTDASPVRAAAASVLAADPNPLSVQALIDATHDKNWIVRLAALEALNRRADPDLRVDVEPAIYDNRKKVHLAAAAVVIHLGELKKPYSTKRTTNLKTAPTSPRHPESRRRVPPAPRFCSRALPRPSSRPLRFKLFLGTRYAVLGTC